MENNDSGHINVIKEYVESNHTEEMQDIISAPPSWLLKWGIMVLFFVLLIMMSVTIFIHYPETVKTSMVLNTYSSSSSILADFDGKLDTILISEHEIVKKNRPLAIIETSPNDNPTKNNHEIIYSDDQGEVLFPRILLTGQHIKKGEDIFYLNQPNAIFFGEMPIAQADIGKVKVGQVVLIKLESYPFQDFGLLKGKIEFISELPNSNNYFISKVKIDVKTSSGPISKVKLKRGMLANAEIITQDVSLFKRMTKNLFKAMR